VAHPQNLELDAGSLYVHTSPDQFDFETTADLGDLNDIIGQPRAVEAVRFGIGIPQNGYNIFAMGSPGTGKRSLVQKFFGESADDQPVPDDICYVYNFQEAHKPNALILPAGTGVQLEDDMETLIEEIRTALSGAFESDEYRSRRQEIAEDVGGRQENALEEIREEAQKRGLRMMRTPGGLAFAPVKDGDIITPEAFQELAEEERNGIEENIQEMQRRLQKVVEQQPILQREMLERVKELNREIAGFAIGGLIDELREKYGEHEEVTTYLDAVQADILDNIQRFLPDDGQGSEDEMPSWLQSARAQREDAFFRRYNVNVIVNHAETNGAPVIFEDNPNYQNLIGRVEYVAQMGALMTDFNLIKAGALHRANGGYLILDARDVLTEAFAWEGLKRALHSGQIRIEAPRQLAGLISTVSVEPEPIPLDVKVALLGDHQLYYLLNALDPDFDDLFKVAADFEEVTGRNEENQRLYALLIGQIARECDLRPFDRGAVARIIERGARLTGDTERLTTHFRDIKDLLIEASYWADEAGHSTVTAEDVQQAVDAQTYRADRIRERSYEAILRDTILIATEGEHVGQVNGLSVLALGGFMFGQPSRITARVRMGGGEVVDIEREVDLSGPIHSKGVLILHGFLGARYATDYPLSLAASLVFEQSYGGVEGDSASSAELYALLSAIAEAPIKQSFAVTGSVNQYGMVQAIGGVNAKIEGFFDICKSRGLTGDQGVLIPQSNVKNLMLRQDVIDAVSAGEFHVYAVETIDQGIELLTGIPAGQPDEEGKYPADTINGRVQARLETMAKQRAEYGKSEDKNDDE
jgi:lon-related putative ATP-dependent protease